MQINNSRETAIELWRKYLRELVFSYIFDIENNDKGEIRAFKFYNGDETYRLTKMSDVVALRLMDPPNDDDRCLWIVAKYGDDGVEYQLEKLERLSVSLKLKNYINILLKRYLHHDMTPPPLSEENGFVHVYFEIYQMWLPFEIKEVEGKTHIYPITMDAYSLPVQDVIGLLNERLEMMTGTNYPVEIIHTLKNRFELIGSKVKGEESQEEVGVKDDDVWFEYFHQLTTIGGFGISDIKHVRLNSPDTSVSYEEGELTRVVFEYLKHGRSDGRQFVLTDSIRKQSESRLTSYLKQSDGFELDSYIGYVDRDVSFEDTKGIEEFNVFKPRITRFLQRKHDDNVFKSTGVMTSRCVGDVEFLHRLNPTQIFEYSPSLVHHYVIRPSGRQDISFTPVQRVVALCREAQCHNFHDGRSNIYGKYLYDLADALEEFFNLKK